MSPRARLLNYSAPRPLCRYRCGAGLAHDPVVAGLGMAQDVVEGFWS